ncbi:MAG: RraA family protein [Bacteroidetes bacterium]|nr:RraA family protein [Bacteroidota bacterium]
MQIVWKNDDELFQIVKRELFTALVGDALDKLGFLHQFLSPAIKPLVPSMVVIGRAMPVLEGDVSGEMLENIKNALAKKPFGLMFEALDDLKNNEVYICSGASYRYALWGGLMSTRAMFLKAAGAVVDGFSRDTNEILNLAFPTFSAGTYAQDQGPRGKVLDYRIPIEFNGIKVSPGDIVFGDRDGVVIVPKEIEVEVFRAAIEKARGEKMVKKALESGMSTVDAFEKFGIM